MQVIFYLASPVPFSFKYIQENQQSIVLVYFLQHGPINIKTDFHHSDLNMNLV